ncbi:hypothetical protein DYB36_011316 [Aphanomyces astaci]|uniref:Uncharacterized protein n=1 Tax=Aphanomyces astaci TaxID=112090 RepID=A0A397BM80_APHAT|nr:hypothetical protein DYB36_011316 [Aphanomyces astaci]
MGIGGWQVVPSGAAPSANRTMESRRSIGGRPIRGDTSEAALSVDHPPVSRSDITTKRLVTNIIPGVLIFVASLLLVVLSVLTLLVLQWTAEMREGSTSYDYFPECLPSTPQDVAGMAVLETTVRDNHVEGLYFVTLYSDLDVTMVRPIFVQGRKHSQLPVVPGWRCGHRVANANELMAIQIVLTLLTLCLLTGDIYVTLEGFRGLVTGEHVMTYNFVAGLERRKALLLCLILNSVPGVLYLDVARIYYFTSNGMQLWALSAVVTATCFSLGWLLVVSYVRHPACCKNSAFETAANKFYAADPYLGLWINNATWPSGSYVATGTPVVLTYLVGEIIYPVVGSFAASILVMTVYRALQHHSYETNHLLIDTTWCRNNSFLRQANMPNFITSLPLEPSVAIRLGHDMYMRPSTLATVGFATVVDRDTVRNGIGRVESCHVVTIYGLVAALVAPGWVETMGDMEQHQFTPSATLCTLRAKKKYLHTRGMCVV